VIGLTETWLKPDEFTMLNEASPPAYTSDHIPRASCKGGVSNINDREFQIAKKIIAFLSFELLAMKSMQPTVYMPPGPEKSIDPLQKAFGAIIDSCLKTYSLPQSYSGPSFVSWNKYCGS
jgi:hypothetical protein